MTLDRVQFIAQQLKALTPGADWGASGVDRATELARILDRNGILDLGRLRIVPVSYEQVTPEYIFQAESGDILVPETRQLVESFAFDYDGRRIGYMGTPDRIENTGAFEVSRRGYLIAWSAEGHGHVGYIVRPNARRTGIEIAPVWDSSSDAASVRRDLLQLAQFVAFVALPLAGLSVGGSIGKLVLGEAFAAAYPSVATALGNAAVATVFNGGDVVGAARSAALGVVGGGAGSVVGAQVQAMTNSPIFGNLVSAVTASAIQGGDAKSAALSSLLRSGVNVMMFAPDDGSTPGVGDILFDDGGGMWAADPLPPIVYTEGGGSDWNWEQPLGEGGTSWEWDHPAETGGGGDWETPIGGGGWDWTPLPTDLPPYEGSIPDIPAVGIPDVTIAQPGSPGVPLRADSPWFNAQQMIGTVTSAAMAALQLVTAFKNLDRPTIQTTARTVATNGAVSVIGSNGLVQTRSPSGTVSYTRPPVGVPQTTVDGKLIVNNGDGSYTVIDAGGQAQTMRYANAGGMSLGSIPPALLLGVGAVLFLAMRRR